MNKRILSIALASLMLAPVTSIAQKSQPTMKDVLGKYFLIGAAVNVNTVWNRDAKAAEVVKKNFNSIVAENCMKGEEIHPEENVYDWKDADQTVKFGEENGLTVIGHCLVWHSQAPKWMFVDKEGKTVSREVLIDRMYHHITNVVGRYKGRIKGWDVINEAFKPLFGYSELSKKQIDQYVKMYLPVLDLKLVSLITEANGRLVAVGISMPSMSKALQKAKGKLTPFGWWHLLKALKIKKPKVLDLMLVGVLPEYQSKGVNSILFYDLLPIYISEGYDYVETNPELESNDKVQQQWIYFERRQHKRRRCYKKEIK